MALEIHEEPDGKLLQVRLTGKLVEEDYAKLVPAVDRAVAQYGKIRMVVEMRDFHGWTAAALWEDTKFAVHHFADIERLAVVGQKKWQEGITIFCKPFTTAKVRYFESTQLDAARTWARSDSEIIA